MAQLYLILLLFSGTEIITYCQTLGMFGFMFSSIQLINKKDCEDNFQVKEIVLYFPSEMHQIGVGRRVAVALIQRKMDVFSFG